VAIAIPFLIVQRDLKRLLAYSSVEHIGLMAVAVGIGGPLGVYAGLLHLVNHAAAKALLFFIAGDLVQRFGTRRMSAMRGAIHVAPILGWGLLLGLLAIAGAPPAGIFVSEFGILAAGFGGGIGDAAASGAVVFLLALGFAGLLAHALRVVYGSPPTAMAVLPTAQSGRWLSMVASVPLVALVLLFGIHVPEQVSELLRQVATVVTASSPGDIR
jgi:hydrogenase-4 component F